MAPARLEFLELGAGRFVNRVRVENGADALQERNEIGIGIAQPANLEDVIIDVEDPNDIPGCADLAKLTELDRARLRNVRAASRPPGS